MTSTSTSTSTTHSSRSPRDLAEAYFSAWQARDGEALRALFSDQVTFLGPMGTATGPEECVAGLIGMAGMIERLEVRARVADDTDVITFFDLVTGGADPTPTANWTHVEDGLITAIRVAFDPRGILAARG